MTAPALDTTFAPALATAPASIDDVRAGSPYVAYLYSYPHKTAYRPLTPPRPLSALWAAEDRAALFLYLHVPFCEMRCGFCNLFTTVRPPDTAMSAYVAALARQARVVRDAVGPARFARVAIGGGTPTYLSPADLEAVLDVAERIMGVDLAAAGVSVETSPDTATSDRLALLAGRGADRLSIGVQSFIDAEVRAVGRAQRGVDVEAALDRIRMYAFRTLNIDLMYGLPGQDAASWRETLTRALAFAPEEIYLYPLYVRPLTGLGRSSRAAWDDERLDLYRCGRDLLRERGYVQVSMRMFRAARADADPAPPYRCQEDGMIGLGAGARSYTAAVHYATEYAVGGRGVKAIIADYVGRDDDAFSRADYGVTLSGEDQRRRYVILSLLAEGLDLDDYERRFASAARADLPELDALAPAGLARAHHGRLVLTDAGVERADAIGPWLYSAPVRALMADYQLR